MEKAQPWQNSGVERPTYRDPAELRARALPLSHLTFAARDRFILKGALVLQIWQGVSARPTRDIDLLGPSSLTVSELEGI